MPHNGSFARIVARRSFLGKTLSPSEKLDLVWAVYGAVVLVVGSLARFFKRKLLLTEPMIGIGIGILLGPYVAGVVGPKVWTPVVLEQGARLTLGVQLTSTALRLPQKSLRPPGRLPIHLLVLGMPLMWIASGLVFLACLGVGFWNAMLLGAIVTPTDPVLASSILSGRFAEENLPAPVREALSIESGANDGLGYLFVFLPILLLTMPTGGALATWVLRVVLWEVVVGTVLGAALGYGAAKLMQFGDAHDLIDKKSFLVFTVAFSVLALGGVHLLGGDGVLAVFAGAVAFKLVVGGRDRVREERVEHAIDVLTMFPVFIFFGAILPWGAWARLGWPALAIVAGILLFRRLPAVIAMRPLTGCPWHETLFAGWFGPIGVGALFYAMLVSHHVHDPRIWPVTSLVVFASTIVHGATSVPLSKLYARRVARRAPDVEDEEAEREQI